MNGTTPIFLVRPGARQEMRILVGPDTRLEFSFDPHICTFIRDGRNLVLSFEDAGRMILEAFYDHNPHLRARTAHTPPDAGIHSIWHTRTRSFWRTIARNIWRTGEQTYRPVPI